MSHIKSFKPDIAEIFGIEFAVFINDLFSYQCNFDLMIEDGIKITEKPIHYYCFNDKYWFSIEYFISQNKFINKNILIGEIFKSQQFDFVLNHTTTTISIKTDYPNIYFNYDRGNNKLEQLIIKEGE